MPVCTSLSRASTWNFKPISFYSRETVAPC
jgi:hypothetical protein